MKKMRHGAWVILLGIGLCFMAFGIIRGEHLAILEKAVMICLECIGIG